VKIKDLILNRRLFLKGNLGGLATLLGLPFLESIHSKKAYAQSLAGQAQRFATFYHPNGVIQSKVGNNLEDFAFFPERQSTTGFDLNQSSLKALQDLGLRDYLTIVKGVKTPNGSGNAHMRGISGFLTGKGLSNDRIQKVSSSIDQILLSKIAQGVQSSSLYMVGNPQLDSPNNSSYNNALKNALCFESDGSLRTPRNDYKKLFDELFAGLDSGSTQQQISKRDLLKLSVLDSVKESREYLNRQVNSVDKAKLDNFYSRIRDVEKKIIEMNANAQAGGAAQCSEKPTNISNLQNYNPNPVSNNVINDLSDVVDNMTEMMAIAFACDRLRIFSFMFGGEAAGCQYTHLGVNKHFHNTLTHNSNQSNSTAKLHRRVDQYHVLKIGQFAKKLSEMDDGGGKSVLDNTVILSGSGLARGYNHTHDPLPILLLGKGGGGIKGGQYLELSGNDKPTGVLLSSILKAMGHGDVKVGDNQAARTFSLS